jgi:hypothetical protein
MKLALYSDVPFPKHAGGVLNLFKLVSDGYSI